jgi:hypothetical protein
LMIQRTILDGAERNGQLQPLEGLDHRFGICGAGTFDAFGQRLDGAVADDRAQTRVFLESGLVAFQEGLMFGRVDGLPRVAGDDPAFGDFVAD